MVDYIGRNAPLEFAKRTKKNLEFIRNAKDEDKDVHEVTQLMNSMLGLVVFIKEDNLLGSDGQCPLREYFDIHISTAKSDTWVQLLSLLRNAIAHHNVEFSSDSGKWEDVAITFWNVPPGAKEPNWKATIEAMKLKDFCYELIDEIGS